MLVPESANFYKYEHRIDMRHYGTNWFAHVDKGESDLKRNSNKNLESDLNDNKTNKSTVSYHIAVMQNPVSS